MDLLSNLPRKGHRNVESTAPCYSSIRHSLLHAWIIVVFCFIGCCRAEISKPLNHAGATGTQIRLNCSGSVDDLGDWSFDSSLERNGLQLIIASDFLSIDDSVAGQMDLKIKLSDKTSGKYLCVANRFSNTADYRPTVQVVVLDAKPECSKEENPDFVKASCSIGFSGYWSPKLEWRNAKGKLETDDKQTPHKNRVNSTITIPFGKTNSDIFTCTPKFTLDNIPQDTTEKNIPEYSSSCTLTIGSTETAAVTSTEKSNPKSDPKSDDKSRPKSKSDDKSESKSDDKSDDKSEKSSGNRSSPAFVSNRNGLSLYLCQCLATMALIGMLRNRLWQ